MRGKPPSRAKTCRATRIVGTVMAPLLHRGTGAKPASSDMLRRLLAASLLLLAAAGIWGRSTAQTARPVVYVIPIDGMVDLGLAPFLARTIREAQQAGAAAVVLDINTFGGRVDAAVAMRDTLVNAPIRTIAFVN